MILKFKDIYKSANDQLHADRNIIETLFEKENKKTIFNYRYASLCGVAAVLILFCVSYGFKDDIHKSHTNKSEIIYSTDSENVPVTEKRVASKNANFDTYISDKQKLVSDTADMEERKMNNAKIATASMENTSEHDALIEVITREEYFEYLGFSASLPATLSGGMTIHEPSEYTITRNAQSGQITEDSNVFVVDSIDSPDKIISVTVGRVNPVRTEIGETKNINGINVNISKSESGICADLSTNGIWCYIVSCGVSLEEFESILSDILCNKNSQ